MYKKRMFFNSSILVFHSFYFIWTKNLLQWVQWTWLPPPTNFESPKTISIDLSTFYARTSLSKMAAKSRKPKKQTTNDDSKIYPQSALKSKSKITSSRKGGFKPNGVLFDSKLLPSGWLVGALALGKLSNDVQAGNSSCIECKQTQIESRLRICMLCCHSLYCIVGLTELTACVIMLLYSLV